MEVSLYGDLVSDEDREEMLNAVADPLYGQSFSLASHISKKGGVDAIPTKRQTTQYSASAGMSGSYITKSNPVFFGVPPSIYSDRAPHKEQQTVICQGLPLSMNEAELRRVCGESIGSVRVVRMLVDDVKTGMFSGTCVLEFSDQSGATKAFNEGVLGAKCRFLTHSEFNDLTQGPMSVLDLGPISNNLRVKLMHHTSSH